MHTNIYGTKWKSEREEREREKKSSILFSHIPCQYNWMKTLLLVLESREREERIN